MRFSCDQCGAQYAIADEKVGDKGVRVRCKKCGNIITVRPERPDEAGSSSTDATTVDREPEPDAGMGPEQAAAGGGEFTTEEEEIGSALDAMFGGDQGDEGLDSGLGDDEEDDDLDRQATRVFSMEDMQLVQSEKEKASQSDQEQFGNLYRQAQQAEAGSGTAGETDPERVEWYVAVEEKQLGPMNLVEMKRHFEAGEIDGDTLVWKAGFEDWLPIQEVAEVQQLLLPGETAAGESAWQEEAAGQAAEEQAGDEEAESEDWRESSDWDDEFSGEEEEEPSGEEEAFPEQEQDEDFADNQVAAFGGGADVDWQPAALGDLESLAESELASLRPPEEDEMEGASLDEMLGDTEISQESSSEDMDDGDSSIIKEIAAEEEKAARQAEQKRLEEERRAEQARLEEERKALEAQEAARREMEEEKRQRAAPPPEQVLPAAAPRGSLPRWAWALFAMGGVVTILLAFLVYKLATAPTPVLTATPPVVAAGNGQAARPSVPTVPARASGQPQQPVKVAQVTRTAGATPTPPGGTTAPSAVPASGSVAATTSKPATAPSPQPVAKVGTSPRPATGSAKRAGSGKPAARPRARKKPAHKRSKPTVVRKEEKKAPPPPPPPRKRSRGGILDFEDEAAFAKETGGGSTPRPEPKKVAVKKQLPPLSNADVLSVMRQHLAEFKACNSKQKEIDRSVRGRMVVKFVIQPTGKVSRVTVTTPEFRNKFVAKCIKKVIRQARFPEFGGGAKTVPFPFTVK